MLIKKRSKHNYKFRISIFDSFGVFPRCRRGLVMEYSSAKEATIECANKEGFRAELSIEEIVTICAEYGRYVYSEKYHKVFNSINKNFLI